jgi:hypothetical protein
MIAILFWVFWIIGLLFGAYRNRTDYYAFGHFGLTWFLLLLLGLKVFGFDLR